MSVLRHVVESITLASGAQAEVARHKVAVAGAPVLERLAARLAAAQHRAAVRVTARTIVVVAGDHGAGDPGVALGPMHPTTVAAREIAAGTAALCQVARSARAPIVVVDAGVAEPTAMPTIAIRTGGRASRDLRREPAMTPVDASLALEAGIALAVSLVDGGLDVLALGALGIGSELASAALLGALAPSRARFDDADPELETAAQIGARLAGGSPLELLATLGGPDTGVLAGLVLGAASMNVPVLLDGDATGAAALVAAGFTPAVTGYLIATHRGGPVLPPILEHLGLVPSYDVGLGHGEGIGAAMVLPLLDQVAALTASG